MIHDTFILYQNWENFSCDAHTQSEIYRNHVDVKQP